MAEKSLQEPAASPESIPTVDRPSQDSRPEDSRSSAHESEYDSAGSYSDDEGKEHHPESEDSVGAERESGDGQESVPSKKVDDDEDKKNPQYIPKRGTFYEHDDRTAEDEEAAIAVEVEKEKDHKKKVWQDKKERWSHDRFNDDDQAPKSKAELVSIYGYDIRNEEGPPKARRRRRYGRGPNKYTRTWEDEDAYSKPPVPLRSPKKSTKKGDEFPRLSSGNANDTADQNILEEENNHGYVETPERFSSDGNGNGRGTHPEPNSSEPLQPRVGSGRVVKTNREIKDSDYKGFTTKTRQVRNVKTEQQIVNKLQKGDNFIQSQNFTNKNNVQDLEKNMGKLNVQDGVYRGGKQGATRQGSVPPRLQTDQKSGSKRYSSMRQRSLPESATPPFNQHSTYYSNEFNQQGQVPQPKIIHQNPQIHPTTPQVTQIAGPPFEAIPQVPVTATPILQAPHFATPFPPQTANPYIQGGVPPTPFIPQQTAQIINYVPGQPQFSQGFQGFQQPFNPVTQPAELYQPQPTGITYYSTDQQISQRMVPQKRPKAAIPIVAPPPIDLKGRIIREGDISSYESEGVSEALGSQGVSIPVELQQ